MKKLPIIVAWITPSIAFWGLIDDSAVSNFWQRNVFQQLLVLTQQTYYKLVNTAGGGRETLTGLKFFSLSISWSKFIFYLLYSSEAFVLLSHCAIFKPIPIRMKRSSWQMTHNDCKIHHHLFPGLMFPRRYILKDVISFKKTTISAFREI